MLTLLFWALSTISNCEWVIKCKVICSSLVFSVVFGGMVAHKSRVLDFRQFIRFWNSWSKYLVGLVALSECFSEGSWRNFKTWNECGDMVHEHSCWFVPSLEQCYWILAVSHLEFYIRLLCNVALFFISTTRIYKEG